MSKPPKQGLHPTPREQVEAVLSMCGDDKVLVREGCCATDWFSSLAVTVAKLLKYKEAMKLMEKLTMPDGSGYTLTFGCRNDDPPPLHAVTVNAEYTQWEDVRFEGDTLLECLAKAEKYRNEKLGLS